MTKRSDASQLGHRPDLRYYKERITTSPENPEVVERATQTITPEMVEELGRKVKGVLKKINILEKEILRTTKDTMPVHEKAHEARHALRALYPDARDDLISIEQFMASLRYQFARSGVDSTMILSILSGNTEVDARILSEAQWAAGDSVDPKELAIIAGQYMLCMVANKILQPYSAQNMQKVAAPKLYPGTEVPMALIQIIMGLAALLLQIVQNEDEVKGLLEESFSSMPELQGLSADDIMAKVRGEETDANIDRYKKGQRPYHHEVLTRYAQDYIQNTNDPGYEGWLACAPLAAAKSEFQQTDDEFGTYGRTAAEADAAPWEMGRNIYRMVLLRTEDMNEQLNRVSAVLSSEITADLLCCLVMVIGAIPTRQLRAVRFALSVKANGINLDLGTAMNSISVKMNNILSEQILEPVLHGIDRFFNKYVGEALKIVDRSQWSDPDLYDIVMACTPFDELLEYALSGLEQLKQQLKALFRKAWRRIEVRSIKGNRSWRLMADCKRTRVYLSLLDKVIESVERGNLCAREGGVTPSADEIEGIVDRLSAGLPSTIEIPVGGDPYETFNPKPFRTASGIDMQQAELSADDRGRTARIADCMRQHAGPEKILKAMGLTNPGRRVMDARNDTAWTDPPSVQP